MLNKKIINIFLLIMLGSSILAFGMYNFNFQNNITEGGVLGLLLFCKNIWNISPSTTSIIIDFTAFAIGSHFFGKSFLIYSLSATLFFSTFYSFFESIGFIVPNLEHNMLLSTVLSGLFVGIGVGIIVRYGGASGGDDVIALIVSKLTSVQIKWVYLVLDCLVLLLSLAYLPVSQIFWSFFAVFISGQVISIIYNLPRKLI
ncbi:MAG: YitT family protein [Cellulosilyticaceae bacterium]